jgi:aspartyl-tRNA(Asn)/glutamyl-tRNA(Gln) amidotransferase subunit A
LTEVPLTIKDAALALREGRTTSVELTQAMLSRADVLDPQLGVNITRMDDTALAAAERADAAFAVGVDRGPLQGIPLGLKDILATDDAPTTAQSLTMDPVWSAQGDGPAVARLRAARAVIVSKNTTMEFANGLPMRRSRFPCPAIPGTRTTGPEAPAPARGPASPQACSTAASAPTPAAASASQRRTAG